MKPYNEKLNEMDRFYKLFELIQLNVYVPHEYIDSVYS